MRYFYLSLAFIFFSIFIVEAALIENYPVKITQPDGKVYNAFISGDEFYRRYHDDKDYTIIHDSKTGWWVYALEKDDELYPSEYKFGLTDPAQLGIKKHAMINPEIIEAKRMEHFRQTIKPNFNKNEKTQVQNTGTIHNVVIFIRFSDDTEFTDDTSTYHSMFNATSGNSMYAYYREVSYNQLSIFSHLYPRPSSNIVKSFQDTAVRNFYRPYDEDSNPIGYRNSTEQRVREHTLLKLAVEAVRSEIPSSLVIDNDNDGYVDNVCFIIKGSNDNWSDLLWPHMWSLWTYNVTINGKRVWGYNFHLQNFLKTYGNGVLSHEMFHTLGAPDLYHYSQDALDPVGAWDLMASTTNPPQHMGAWMKYTYGGWISSIPVISSNGTYSLNPLTSSSGNCYRINSPNSTTQWFLVEFRKKNSTFESAIPGSGLLVYRIIPDSVPNGNMNGPPDEVYIYRPNGTTTQNGIPNNAYFSSESGRTGIDSSTNPTPFLADGSAGGLIIRNIGSSAGSTISFTVGGPGISAPNLVYPQNMQIAISVDVAFVWNSVNGASSYDIQVSTNSSFSTTVFDQTGVNDTTITVSPNLSYNTTYYWRVRAVGTGTSSWTTSNFTTKLEVPTLASPVNNAYGVDEESNFNWNSISGANSYELQISEFSNFTSINYTTTSSNNQFVMPSGVLDFNTLYYWRVRAKNSTTNNESDWSNVWSFTSILAPPTLLIPADDSLGVDVNGRFLWTNVSGADGFKLEVSKSVVFSSLDINQSNLTDTTFNFSNLSYDTKYYWRVRAFNSNQNGRWSSIFSFTTNLKPPNLIYPSNDAKQVSINTELKWEYVSNAENFDLQIAQDTAMNNLIINEIDLPNDTTYQCNDLLSMTKHYWRVRAKNSDGRVSSWSNIFSFTTKLGTPTIPSPADSAENVSITGDLVWNAILGANSYHVQLSTNENFSTTIINDSSVAGESIVYENLTPNITYYWRVRAKSGSNSSDWSKTWMFKTGVGRVTLTSPSLGATGVPLNGNLKWEAMPGAASYDLILSDQTDLSNPVYNETDITTNQFAYSNLDANTTYYWKVRAVDSDDNPAEWSSKWHFTTTAGEPMLLTPVDGKGGMDLSDTLIWQASDGAESYQVQIATDSNFSSIKVNESNISDTRYIYHNFDYYTKYFWRVRSSNSEGNSQWSQVRTFYTLIQNPELLEPSNNSINQLTELTLKWNDVKGAESYRLLLSDKLDFSNIIVDENIDGNQYTLTGLDYLKKYYWKVMANHHDRNSDFSSVWNFITGIECPLLDKPDNNAQDLKFSGRLTWFAVMGAENYHLQLAKDENFTDIVIDVDDIIFTYYDYNDLEEFKDYYWRVGSIYEDGKCEWSEVRTFKTRLSTSVNELQNNNLLTVEVIPNPVSIMSTVNLYSSFDLTARVMLYDAYGKFVMELSNGNLRAGLNTVIFNVAELNSGVYQIVVLTNRGVINKRIVVIK